jgi:Domain of unknown function (DUF4439)
MSEPLQDALAAEHATVYLYGVLGARSSESATPVLFATLTDCYRHHRGLRDQLRLMLLDAGAEPVAAAPAYDVPPGWTTPDAITEAARGLEESTTESMAALVARTSGDHRRWALGALTWSAVRQLDLGGMPETWPGAPQLD